MSFLAKLDLDGELHNLLDCSFVFNQPVSENNKPSGRTKGGQLEVTIELAQHLDILDWMVQSKMTKKGEVIFYKQDSLSKQIALKFEEGFCTHLTGNFHSYNNEPLKISFTITAATLSFNESVSHQNLW